MLGNNLPTKNSGLLNSSAIMQSVDQEVCTTLESGDEVTVEKKATELKSNGMLLEIRKNVYKRRHTSTSPSSSSIESDPALLARRRIQINRYNEMKESYFAKNICENEPEVEPKSSAHDLRGLLEKYLKQQATATRICPALLYWDSLLKQLSPHDAQQVEKDVTMFIWDKVMALNEFKN